MPTPSPLLTLPPDLRQRIYTHLLVSPTPLKGRIARQHQNEKCNLHTSILRVNKQIGNEAKHIFFGLNTFSISSVPPTQSQIDDGEGSGAFEPPLQLKDLNYVRSLEIDLAYAGPGSAERYMTSLSFLLAHAKTSHTQLSLVGDARPHTSPDGSLDHRAFLAGFHAATLSARFQAALTALPVQSVDVKFEFEDMRFDFDVRKEVLVGGEWSLEWLAGQVLLKRVELGLGGILGEVEDVVGGDEVLEGEGAEKWW